MSPFLTYAEVMPSKPSKEFCQSSLISFLQHLVRTEVVVEQYNSKKKPRIAPQQATTLKVSLEEIKALKKEEKLAFGLQDVQKMIQKNLPTNQNSAAMSHGMTLFVCIVYNQEIEIVCKHLISLCRQLQIKHLVVPKFCGDQLAQLFRVKRLTCFSLLDCFEESQEKFDFLQQASAFDNSVQESQNLS